MLNRQKRTVVVQSVSMIAQQYGPRVVIVVYDQEKDLCLACMRSDREQAWQFPQGNVEMNETNSQAAVRELFEETGIIAESQLEVLNQVENKICITTNCCAEVDFARENYQIKISNPEKFSSVKFIKNSGPHLVDYPKYVKRNESGQEQFWFLAIKTKPIGNITLNYEFSHYAWMKPKNVVEHIVDFKKSAYKAALKDFGLLYA